MKTDSLSFSMLFIYVSGSGHNYIAPEHLLLALLREGEGVSARVLEALGADISNIRTQASIGISFQKSGYFYRFMITLKLKDYAFGNIGH